jgi:hypothetical protein
VIGQVWELALDRRLGMTFTLVIVQENVVPGTDHPAEPGATYVLCLVLDATDPGYGLPPEFSPGSTQTWNASWFDGSQQEARRIA